MNLHLDDKLALVTASTGGIGKEIATSLAREGATVIVRVEPTSRHLTIRSQTIFVTIHPGPSEKSKTRLISPFTQGFRQR